MRAPGKATWLRLETDPEFFFEFFLAEKLGMTLWQVRQMPCEEFMQWGVYFGKKAQQRELAMKGGGGGR